jgi:BlaI family penicillinase repressor
MTRKAASVTETEQAILDVLWKRESSTIREIVEEIYPAHSASCHATVKSLLDRLAAKGYVECDTTGFTHRYSARVSRDQFVSNELSRLAGSHFDGAFAPLLLSLVDKIELSDRERKTIQKIIESMPKKH